MDNLRSVVLRDLTSQKALIFGDGTAEPRGRGYYPLLALGGLSLGAGLAIFRVGRHSQA